jgi:hypothetical protein
MSEENKENELEKNLLSRLQFLGLVLLGFSVIAVSWAILFSPNPTNPEDLIRDEKEITLGVSPQPNRLNFYAIAAIFTTVGLSCLIIGKKRSKEF